METTLYMHIDILEKITYAASLLEISRSEMIMLLIKQLMKHTPDSEGVGTMIRYQQRSIPGSWHTFHIRVKMDDYEYMLDVRKIFKMSVSLILAYAVNRYLDKLLKTNTTDNYRFNNYVLIREVVDNIICWRSFWGYPRNLDQLIPHHPVSRHYP